MDSDQKKTRGDHPSGGAAKAPYVKPAFRHEKVFETMALACGKINATQLSCLVNRKNS
jgi:hypothetical protein